MAKAPIPEVDLTFSQEENVTSISESHGKKKRKEREDDIVVILPCNKDIRSPDTPNGKRKIRDSMEIPEIVTISERLYKLEKMAEESPSYSREESKVTRKEFDKLAEKVGNLVERVQKIEQVMENVKAAFTGTTIATPTVPAKRKSTSVNDRSINDRVSKTMRQDDTASSATYLQGKGLLGISNQAEGETRSVVNGTVLQSNANDNSPEESTVSVVQASSSSASASDSVEKNANEWPSTPSTSRVCSSVVQLGRSSTEQVSPLKNTRVSGQNLLNNPISVGQTGGTISSTSAPSPSQLQPRRSSTEQVLLMENKRGSGPILPNNPISMGQTGGTMAHRTPVPSRSLKENSVSTSSETAVSQRRPGSLTSWSPSMQSSSSNVSTTPRSEERSRKFQNGMRRSEDLPDSIIPLVRIKKEVCDDSTVDRISPITNFRKHLDYFLVCIMGKGRKVFRKEKYIAVAGFSLAENWNHTVPFLSDLVCEDIQKNKVRLQQENYKIQAEFIAAYLAIKDLKQNSPKTGCLKIMVVSKIANLIITMNLLQDKDRYREIYMNLHQCACKTFPCPHKNRWSTVNKFAEVFKDDIPRLFLTATDGVEVKWVLCDNDPNYNKVMDDIGNEIHLAIQDMYTRVK